MKNKELTPKAPQPTKAGPKKIEKPQKTTTPVTSSEKKKEKVVQIAKEVLETEKETDDIDDIFAQVKQNKALAKKTKPKQPKASDEPDDGFKNMRGAQQGRKVKDGVAVYTMDELKIGKGGNTEQCPFE
jgi:hypothetical protein